MENEVAIRVKNITKQYRLYDSKMDRLKEAIFVSQQKHHNEFLALKDVSFEIKKGETIGLIGKNGSGKSTLLKILTGIITPSQGEIEVNGKVSALLELGAGFNPEYTGLENIYLNGTILGFSKKQIDDKLSEIISFADIGDFINHPVKLYSSGMFVRLAYAVQACIDPEILIIDEALAVGDAAFSLKCMNHMKKLVAKGVTVIMVTHDVQAIRSFCSRVIWLQHGEVIQSGDPSEVTSAYVKSLFHDEKEEMKSISNASDKEVSLVRWGNNKVVLKQFALINSDNVETDVVYWGEQIKVRFEAEVIDSNIDFSTLGFAFGFRNKHGLDLIVATTFDEGNTFEHQNSTNIQIEFALENILTPGDYSLVLSAEDRKNSNPEYYDFIENAVVFKVLGDKRFFSLVQPKIEQKIDVNGNK